MYRFSATTLEQKEKATEIAKQNILHEYYAVGVLEHFEETLKLFEALLPEYFKNAVPVWKSDCKYIIVEGGRLHVCCHPASTR